MNAYKFIAKHGLKAAINHLNALENDLIYSDFPCLIAPEIEPKIKALKEAIGDMELVNAWGGFNDCVKRLKSIKHTYPLLPNKCYAAKLELTVIRIYKALEN